MLASRARSTVLRSLRGSVCALSHARHSSSAPVTSGATSVYPDAPSPLQVLTDRPGRLQAVGLRHPPADPLTRWAPLAGVLGGVHGPCAEPHVRAVQEGDARHRRHAQGGVPRGERGDHPGQRHLRHGGRRAPLRHQQEGHGPPQRLLLVPVDAHLRDVRNPSPNSNRTSPSGEHTSSRRATPRGSLPGLRKGP